MTNNKDPTSAPPREYDCASCRFIYDERTGLCSVCLRKILDAQRARPQARKTAEELCESCTSSTA
ncbi:MAG: hypothetical protein LBG83_09265 [Oscillospiraceae bacterium]|jgi:hypothetical protein|nr:hypothetical protein [Oscillospiraceae bacterium]